MSNPFEELASRIENRIDRFEELFLSPKSKSQEFNETLNIPQASKVCKISVSKTYDLARRGIIPASRIGNRYVFIKSDLINWLRTQSK